MFVCCSLQLTELFCKNMKMPINEALIIFDIIWGNRQFTWNLRITLTQKLIE